ncbi:DUF6227 family protein [Streptomyces paradoxus]|uniref:DUF6227 family protein n=1 Tax=Streptomyces paradoxus TaxID=66375 RepID=UPI00370245EF
MTLLDQATNIDHPEPEIRARLETATTHEETIIAEQASGRSGTWRITRHSYTLIQGDTQELWVLERRPDSGGTVVEVFYDEIGPILRLGH